MSDIAVDLFVDAPPVPDTFNVMLFGPPGSGKSTAAATAPGPILWVNAEGAGALAYARKVAKQRGHQILEVRLEKNTDPRPQLRETVKYIRSGQQPTPRTVVVDTVGKLRELLIEALVQPGAKNTLQQFGDVSKAVKDIVLTLRDLDVNLVLLAHESVEDADGDRIVRPQIAASGNLTEHVVSEVDVLAYTHAHKTDEGVQYLGQLVEGRGRRAKDRSGALGSVRPLELSEWLDAYREGLTEPDPVDVPWSESFDTDTPAESREPAALVDPNGSGEE